MKSQARKVLVTVPFFDEAARAFLEANHCQVQVIDGPDGDTPASLLIESLRQAQAWIVGHARVTREVLEACPQLLVIARRGVGYERVDVAAAAALGRVVTIAAGGNAASVADHTVGMMLAAGRRFHESQQRMSAGAWSILAGTELYAKRVGLIGFGRIAQLVAKRLAGFDAEVLVFSPRLSAADAQSHGVRPVDFPVLLNESDYVSLHVPLNEQTAQMIDAAALRAMKPTSILINTSRGGLIDEVALRDALQDGRIRAAALDVFHFELDPIHRPIAEELLALPNLVATPHSAGSTTEALMRSNWLAAQSVVALLDGRAVETAGSVVVDGRRSN